MPSSMAASDGRRCPGPEVVGAAMAQKLSARPWPRSGMLVAREAAGHTFSSVDAIEQLGIRPRGELHSRESNPGHIDGNDVLYD